MRTSIVYTFNFLFVIALLISVYPSTSVAIHHTKLLPGDKYVFQEQVCLSSALVTPKNLVSNTRGIFVAEGRGYGSPPSHGAPSNSPSYDRAPIAQPPSRSSGVMHYNSYDGAPLSSPPEQGRWVINPPEHQTNDVSLPLHEQVAHPELVVKEGRGAKAPVDETAPSLAPE